MTDTSLVSLEPISNSAKQHAEGGELHETKEILDVVLPANEQAALSSSPHPAEATLAAPAG